LIDNNNYYYVLAQCVKWIWIQETHENTVCTIIIHSTNVITVIEQY